MASPEQSRVPIKTAETQFQTTMYGDFRLSLYEIDGKEHMALVKGDVRGKEDVLVRVESSCVTGTALHSARCDCAQQRDYALDAIDKRGNGVFLYMSEEGRNLGLRRKIQIYALEQSEDLDTFDAAKFLGLEPDPRTYQEAASILIDLGVKSAILITNNPAKSIGLARFGIPITGKMPTEVPITEAMRPYIEAKIRRGHSYPQL